MPPSELPRIVIVVASKHGSTRGIAGALAQEFVSRGAGVTVLEADDDARLGTADAVVLGSAVYLGRWMKPARRFVERRAGELARRQVWLFSSGPLGDTHESGLEPDHLDWLIKKSGALDHREFGGRLDPSDLGPIESLVSRSLHPPAGDYRDWEEIRTWADDIFARLKVA